jgi:hypothetical protein
MRNAYNILIGKRHGGEVAVTSGTDEIVVAFLQTIGKPHKI